MKATAQEHKIDDDDDDDNYNSSSNHKCQEILNFMNNMSHADFKIKFFIH